MTKRIPGAKRGRPAKPKQAKPPKRSRGRPPVSLRDHPDRYTVARFDVADWWLKQNVKGNRTRARMVLWRVADMRKAADSLRTMARRYRKPADMEWRKAIGTAVAFALQIAADPARNPTEFAILRDHILSIARDVGEAEWARREVLPLMALRPSFPMEEHDLLTFLAHVVVTIGWATDIDRLMRAADAQTKRGSRAVAAQGPRAQR
jgi:hypothetical protein